MKRIYTFIIVAFSIVIIIAGFSLNIANAGNNNIATQEISNVKNHKLMKFIGVKGLSRQMLIRDLFDNHKMTVVHYMRTGNRLVVDSQYWPEGVTEYYVEIFDNNTQIKLVETKDGITHTQNGLINEK